MEVEEIFCSRVRMKILKLLVRVGEFNVSEIARKLRINYETTIKHLRVLESEGILQHKDFGRIHLYRINESSPKAKAIQKLLEAWEQTRNVEKT